VAAEIKRIIDFDQISLFLNRGTSTNPEVITIGKSGGVLVERRKGSSGIDNIMAKVMYTKRAWVDHIPNHSNDKMSRFLGDNCGIRSQIILPLVQGESTYGALSLGHQETGFYSSGDEKWLKPLVLVLSGLVFEQVQNERLARKEFLDRSLSDFEKRLVVEDSVYSLIKDITEKLTTEMPKSFVRFSLLNQRKDQLVSFATHQIRSEGIDLNKEERFPLEKLPWHRLTLTAKKPMLINQEDPESYMSKNEAGLIMDERIKSGILIPLLLEDVAVGVISVGEMRSWSRVPLTPAEIGYIKHRTNQACVALKKGLLSRLNARLKEKLKKNEIPEKTFPASSIDQNPFFNLSYKINNTLTAIRGSAELLKFSLSDLKPDKLKYLKTIENGADRIHSCLEEFSYSPHVHTKEEKLVPAQKETVSS
jgi:transcriptional regulator with GAF, ATPase, and Fis domain